MLPLMRALWLLPQNLYLTTASGIVESSVIEKSSTVVVVTKE